MTINIGSLGGLIVAGTAVSIATLMTMGLVKTTMDGFYQIKGSNKTFKNADDLEKELNSLGYNVK